MSEAPRVKVSQGELLGRTNLSPSGTEYFSFQGIPYAKPPLGSLRFKDPEPAESWEGTRDATTEGNIAAQINIFRETSEFEGGEDCLFLNVYTPNLDGEFLPVMVFIHGGGFQCGSGNTDEVGPEFLVEKDVVLVTFNYRCGALGFLCLNTPEVPGNAGLKDQALALKWVKENIGNFGGNAGNITIFGESAGGASVGFKIVSPLTKNLFNKAILQSGTSLNHWAVQNEPLKNARNLVQLFGSDATDVDEMLNFLQAVPVKELVEATNKIRPLDNIKVDSGTTFSPVVEKEFPGKEAYLAEPVIDILSTGRAAKVPVIIGSVGFEALFVLFQNNFHLIDDARTFIPKEFHLENNSEEAVKLAEDIKKLYLKGAPVGVETSKQCINLVSDFNFNYGIFRFAKLLIHSSTQPVYFYKFNYVGGLNAMKKALDSFGLDKASHADDLGYLFKMDALKDVEVSPEDDKTRQRLVKMWTNFAKTGNPTPEESYLLTVSWLPFTNEHPYYLEIDRELSLKTNPDQETMGFWENLYSKYYKTWNQVPLETFEPRTFNSEVTEVKQPEHVDVPQIIETQDDSGVSEEQIEEQEQSQTNGDDVQVIENLENVKVYDENKSQETGEENVVVQNGHGGAHKTRTTNEIKMLSPSNGVAKDVIRANDPPEDDLPKNVGVNKFVNFFESLGGKK